MKQFFFQKWRTSCEMLSVCLWLFFQVTIKNFLRFLSYCWQYNCNTFHRYILSVVSSFTKISFCFFLFVCVFRYVADALRQISTTQSSLFNTTCPFLSLFYWILVVFGSWLCVMFEMKLNFFISMFNCYRKPFLK